MVTTPKTIKQPVVDFTLHKLRGATPRYVAVQPDDSAQMYNCFFNVKSLVETQGGEIVFGWCIWVWPKAFIEAEHHAIWRRPDGIEVDITPKEDGEKRVLFSESSRDSFDFETGIPLSHVRAAISNTPAILKLLRTMADLDAMRKAKGLRANIELKSHRDDPNVMAVIGAYTAAHGAMRKQFPDKRWHV